MKIISLGQLRSRSDDVIHDVMFERNRPILLSIVSRRVSLLSGACFCIADSINGVYGYFEVIYSCPGVKVMPGHAPIGRFRSPFRPLFFLTQQFSWTSGTLFRAKPMPDSEPVPTNWLCKTCYMSRPPKVIRGHLRSLTSDDPKWSNLLLGSTIGCFGVF